MIVPPLAFGKKEPTIRRLQRRVGLERGHFSIRSIARAEGFLGERRFRPVKRSLPPCGIISPMRRIGRWMLNGLTVLSLVLCVGMGVLWVRSYKTWDMWTWTSRQWRAIAGNNRGDVSLVYINWTVPGKWHDPALGLSHKSKLLVAMPRFVNRPIGWASGADGDFSMFVFRMHHWLAVLITSVAPCVWVIRKRRRAKTGCCGQCRYNLTGNISGVCPECGMAVADRSSKGAASRSEERAPHPPAPARSPEYRGEGESGASRGRAKTQADD